MTRTSSSIPLRLASTAIAAVAVLSLSGCLYAQIPAGSPTGAPSSSPETDAPSDERSGSTLTFAEGLDLASDTYIEWGDGLVVDEGWKIVSPDDGNGGWTYGTVDGTCTARFWQGYTTDVPVVAGDDSASSDAILGVLLQTPTSEVTPLATTGEFSYMAGGSGGVETRQVVGVDGSRTWLMAARAFTQTGVGLSVVVDCTAADAEATLAAINEENAVVVTP
ncbi:MULTISPECIES: hypothetical protein [Microbacterium]|uniref:Uncharacterized protein n=2 Tax=Microbacterium maritypicum TaxID=33918 RepID=A0ACD4B509_MICMQ|nr:MULTISPECIES: hypothetical protein [Microbacterium]EYT60898.1 hypothetical protein D514_0105515 [Microbacterium sp. UCD-TDU]MBP5801664.1 hypothetical protein [Microbacterium liquefaciens]UTT52740.1 hypothetical protein NMQ05_16915 [Microbacterium liquefaciens]WEF20785.1 hypothetical protein PWF71_16055 [Microbacterium liquefaciens]